MAGEKRLIEATELLGKSVGPELVRFGNGEKLDEESRQLHDVVVRAPGVAVARAHGEP